jgi:hypothetical protein
MKKLPKAQLGAIVKGIRAGLSAGKGAYTAAKTGKPRFRPRATSKNNSGSKDVSIPAYIATYGAAGLAAAGVSGAFNKKPNINSRGTETVIHTGANGKKYVKVTTPDGKIYNKTIEPKKKKGGLIKNLPKAQLGGIIKGVSKIIKPAAKAVKKVKNPRMDSNSDYLKWQAKQIGVGALLAAPVYGGLVGAVNYDNAQANKKKFTNTKGTETKVHKGKDGKKYVKVTTRDGKIYNKTIK